MKIYKWFTINDEKKSEINKLKPVFIAGSRDMTEKRIEEVTQMFLGKANILWGCLEDRYINGLEGSPQFTTLPYEKLEKVLKNMDCKNVSMLRYFERDTKHILKEIDFKAVIYIQGSWFRSFQYNSHYFELLLKKTAYKMISPFSSEDEAKKYPKSISFDLKIDRKKRYSDKELMELTFLAAKQSYDHTYQIGAILAKEGYVLLSSYNAIVPYETYAMHHGASREKSFASLNEAGVYDTNHAEIEIIIRAMEEKIDLPGTTLYMNVLPCPVCARALVRTGISEIVYSLDHSDGYAIKMLESAGKVVRRIVL